MGRIVPGVCTLKQHQQALAAQPERYRPPCCPQCGKAQLWSHGTYTRKADREGVGEASLNPVAIARFFCPACRRTCSRVPECVAARRWYGWAMQQVVLALLLAGESIRSVGGQAMVSRRTVGRWWRWLRSCVDLHGFHLRCVVPSLGRGAPGVALWSTALGQRPLSAWMATLDRLGVVVP